jgi:hypothetical protein
MRYVLLAAAAAATALAVTSSTVSASDTYVRGHTRQDGAYVQPHHRTNPDSSLLNNYSTQGNTNPYTGRAGTVDPYKAPSAPSGNSPGYGGSTPYGTNRRW